LDCGSICPESTLQTFDEADGSTHAVLLANEGAQLASASPSPRAGFAISSRLTPGTKPVEEPMPIHIPAEATCDHCGKVAPCKVKCLFDGSITLDDRRYERPGLAIRGLPAWFWKRDGMACSESCKEVLARDPRYDFSGPWMPCGE
jgi:ferredoxin